MLKQVRLPFRELVRAISHGDTPEREAFKPGEFKALA